MGQQQTCPTPAEAVFEMRLKSRELGKMASRCNKEEVSEKQKVKRALAASNHEGARIFAENSIRKHHEALNYLRLSSKMDAVACRLDAARRSQQLHCEIHRALPTLAHAMGSLDVTSLAMGVDSFQRLFEELDVRSDFVANVVEDTSLSSSLADETNNLISEIADEFALDFSSVVPRGCPTISSPTNCK